MKTKGYWSRSEQEQQKRGVAQMAQSKAHMDAASRFNKKTYDRIQVSIRKDAEINRDVIRNHAQSRGESTNGFLLRAVTETIRRDKGE